MKYATLLLLSFTAFAQNPDGSGISVQFTPYYSFGKIESTVKTNYPHYNSSGTLVSYRNVWSKVDIDKDRSFNYSLIVKYPVANQITMSMFYQSLTDGYETNFIETNRNTPISLITKSVNRTTNIGGTFTFYLFQ